MSVMDTEILGTVTRVSLRFPEATRNLTYEPDTYSYSLGLSYIGERTATATTTFHTVAAVAYAIERLFEVNRLDLVKYLIAYPEFRSLGIEVEVEFTSHVGEVVEIRFLTNK